MSTKPKSPAKPRKPKQIVKERILARYDFNPAEMAERGGDSGRITNESNTLRDDAKGVANDFKAKIELKESARNALATKLANGYEMREATALVLFDTKKRIKRFVDPKNKKHVFREEAMTEADWQLPMFRREEVSSRKPAGANDKEKAPAGKTNVGAKLDEAVSEAAGAQTRLEIDLDGEISDGAIPKKLIAKFKKAAKAAKWPENVIKPVAAHAEAKADAGITEVADALRSFCIKK